MLLDILTAPLEWAYGAVSAARNSAYDRGLLRACQAEVPVISVGNLSVGGAGKTPVSGWLVAELERRGRWPALLHGGYAEDEPELHRSWSPAVPVLAQRDRAAAAASAVAAGADVLVLDDAFQHRRIRRDLDLLLMSCETWGRRVRLLPRGGWREPVRNARRADLIAVTRRTASLTEADETMAELARLAPGRPLLRFLLEPAGWLHKGKPAAAPGSPAFAVSAVADPGSFLKNARTAGASLRGWHRWRDHHRYRPDDAEFILARAEGGPIVTTEKDWVKLGQLLPPDRVWVLRQKVTVEAGMDELDAALDRVLQP